MNVAIPNAQSPSDGVLTGGQPSEAHFVQARDQGLRTVINLRGLGEPSTDVQPALMARLGLTYVSIPVSGPGDITVENARRLGDAMATSEGPVMVHCASGNRVGALFALKAFSVDGKTHAEALAIGRSAGLTRLEPLVVALMGNSGA